VRLRRRVRGRRTDGGRCARLARRRTLRRRRPGPGHRPGRGHGAHPDGRLDEPRVAAARPSRTGRAVLSSRSRGRPWCKGEEVRPHPARAQRQPRLRRRRGAARAIEQVGGIACHTGRAQLLLPHPAGRPRGERRSRSALSRTPDVGGPRYGPPVAPERTRHPRASSTAVPAAVRAQRRSRHSSYVARLHHQGLDAILKKIGEEATEAVMAAKDGDPPAACCARSPTCGSMRWCCLRTYGLDAAARAPRTRAPRGRVGARREGCAQGLRSCRRSELMPGLHLLPHRPRRDPSQQGLRRTTSSSSSTTSGRIAGCTSWSSPSVHVESLAHFGPGEHALVGRMLLLGARLAPEQGSPMASAP
jgi:hypothetical protein